ncbi:MAG: SCO family protein [Planctomycetales bacterium]|nr:SCO family protein [Planctomycetales bacterium]
MVNQRFNGWIVAVACMFVQPALVRAQLNNELPFNARGIDVEDKVGEFVPLNLVFQDERGTKIGLGQFFKKGKPIVLTLNYSDCPGLCIAQLDNLVNTMRELNGANIGDDFEMVTVSIDPSETITKSKNTKAKYTGLLPGTKAEEGWHFLVGSSQSIAALADAVGYRYTYDSANKRYNHPAVTYFLSADGRICRYLLSLGVEPDQFKLALMEARQGKLTWSPAQAIIQFCYLYDPDANRYSASARRMMAFAGAAFVMLLTGFTAPFWFSRKSKNDQAAANPHADANGGPKSQAAPYNEEKVDHHTLTGT